MNNILRPRLSGTIVAISLASLSMAAAASPDVTIKDEARPAAITIQNTDDGVVFATKNGMTIYTAEYDKRGQSTCTNKVATHGDDGKGDVFVLPNQGHRPTCLSQHPLVAADRDSKPVGLWTIIDRPDGMRQWAYDGKALYTSIKDVRPGETNANVVEQRYRSNSTFRPLHAQVILPPQVGTGIVGEIGTVQVLTSGETRLTLYVSDADTDGKSHCEGACQEKWQPLLAPIIAKEQGGWTAVRRSDGSRQWALKGKPVYTYYRDVYPGDYKGNGQPGWEVALAVPLAKRPDAITITQTVLGPRFGDPKGLTLYIWQCRDPGLPTEPSQTECDNPQDRSAWWLTTCVTAAKCADTWRPVTADKNATAVGTTWSIITLPQPWAPVRAAEGQSGVKVWAYKGKPVFTYKFEDRPGLSDGENNGDETTQQWESIIAEGYDITPSQKKPTQVRAASR